MNGPIHIRFIAMTGLACLAVQVAEATATPYSPAPFSNYQPILDRMPFGAPPPDPGLTVDPAQAQNEAQVQEEQQKLAKQVSMSCVNITPDGSTAVGFTDLNEKPPVNYYLRVGSASHGWSVVQADYDGEWAQIEKDGITITLKLGKGLIDGPPATAVAAVPQSTPIAPVATTVESKVSPTTTTAPRLGLIRRPSQPNMPPMPGISPSQMAEMQKTKEELAKIKESGGDIKSYMDRLRERKAQEKADKAAAEEAARQQLQELARKITDEELRKREHEINLNLIEQGAKPVSDVQLTPEEEAALVEKGVLTQ